MFFWQHWSNILIWPLHKLTAIWTTGCDTAANMKYWPLAAKKHIQIIKPLYLFSWANVHSSGSITTWPDVGGWPTCWNCWLNLLIDSVCWFVLVPFHELIFAVQHHETDIRRTFRHCMPINYITCPMSGFWQGQGVLYWCHGYYLGLCSIRTKHDHRTEVQR